MRRWPAPFFLIVIAAALTGCTVPKKVEAPTIELQDVVLLNAKGLMQHLRVELLVSNPNNFDIPLTGLRFDMQVNGKDFAEGLSNHRVDIPRLGRTVVPVDVAVSALVVMRQIRALSRAKSVDYRVVGTAFLDHTVVPEVNFEREGKVTFDIEGRRKSFKVM